MKTALSREMSRVEWSEELLGTVYTACVEMGVFPTSDTVAFADEVFDSIVQWFGGMGSGYSIRSLVSRVYGVELS